MASTQNLRRRIKSVKNTRQITKAMELVAAAKMRRAQEMTLGSRQYSQAARESLVVISHLSEGTQSPLLNQPAQPKRGLLIVVTSDKGLAGAYNSFILKKASNYLKDQIIPHDIITVGRKGQDFFKQIDTSLAATFTDFPPYPVLGDTKPITHIAITDFISRKYDLVSVAYTHFHSTVRQEAIITQLLPVDIQSLDEEDLPNYTFEPTKSEVIDTIVPRLIEVQFYQFMLESIASEHSARMVAMKNASDNAKDITDDLQLTYNSARQSSITQELAEITAGVAALS